MFFRSTHPLQLGVDIHSHLLPGVDDGVKTLAESVDLIRRFESLGYKRLVTSPHISDAYYPNKVEDLELVHKALVSALNKEGIGVEVSLGAEYMVDEAFLERIKKNQRLLSWDGYLLMETSFHNFPMIFDEVTFELQSQSIVPIYAHPERYEYFYCQWERLLELKQKGILFQVNAGSFQGIYGSGAKKMAREMLKKGLIDFIGSDAHGKFHLDHLASALNSKPLRKTDNSRFLNGMLLN